jgi:drug/metabolite transporter (DMT)-like permease
VADDQEQQSDEVLEVGPDPVWGVCIGVGGLIVMAVGGALTRHWWFNIGEAFLLLGAMVFLASLAIGSIRRGELENVGDFVREAARGDFARLKNAVAGEQTDAPKKRKRKK